MKPKAALKTSSKEIKPPKRPDVEMVHECFISPKVDKIFFPILILFWAIILSAIVITNIL